MKTLYDKFYGLIGDESTAKEAVKICEMMMEKAFNAAMEGKLKEHSGSGRVYSEKTYPTFQDYLKTLSA